MKLTAVDLYDLIGNSHRNLVIYFAEFNMVVIATKINIHNLIVKVNIWQFCKTTKAKS